MSQSPQKKNFSLDLLKWYRQSHRPMPWKNIRDPYLIWVSEIILQQTRVNQGWAYYERFRDRFPHIKSLAEASTDEVLKIWEGLGYYSRARNMHKAARLVQNEYGGKFPENYQDLLKLPGIGEYTAAAISSFAFDLPHAVVDGNVIRVISRYFGLGLNGENERSLKLLVRNIADQLISDCDPAEFNQAIMDFGATCCMPVSPVCKECQLKPECYAYNHLMVTQLPPKKKKPLKRNRYFNFYLFQHLESVIIRIRAADDIWKNLYELPSEEVDDFKQDPDPSVYFTPDHILDKRTSPVYRHQLTHQTIYARFIICILKQPVCTEVDKMLYVDRKNLCNFAFPKLIQNFLKEQDLI